MILWAYLINFSLLQYLNEQNFNEMKGEMKGALAQY